LVVSAALLERNDISGLPISEDALTKQASTVPGYLIHNLDYAISQGVHDDRAIPVLARLLLLPEVETRRAAASALWHTHSRSAVSGLIQALNDEDFEVRYYGVVGLAEITGELEWHPNMEVFHQDETKYLQHWREWSNANDPATANSIDKPH
jgi:HEAT repeat protein